MTSPNKFEISENWMQRNPFLSMLTTIILTALSSFAIVSAEWNRQDKVNISTTIEKKADVEYVDKQVEELNNKIDNYQKDNNEMLKEIRTDIKYILKQMPK